MNEAKHAMDHEGDSHIGVEVVEQPVFIGIIPPHVEEVNGVTTETPNEENGGQNSDEDIYIGEVVSVGHHLVDWTRRAVER